MKIAIVKAKWNNDITSALALDANKKLAQHNVEVLNFEVGGAVELAVAAKNIIQRKKVDAVICIGAVIYGETDHYDYVCKIAAEGINQVGIETGTPVIFGVLTCRSEKQAWDRTNGEHSFCGIEWAETAMEMVSLIDSLK